MTNSEKNLIKKIWKKIRYRGAGTLFFTEVNGTCEILLARRKSGFWSIAGGRANCGEDLEPAALRETKEEFGVSPESARECFHFNYPLAVLGFGFRWKTVLHELSERTQFGVFPDPRARDFYREFSKAEWFPIDELPARTNWLVCPVVWKLKRFIAKRKRGVR